MTCVTDIETIRGALIEALAPFVPVDPADHVAAQANILNALGGVAGIVLASYSVETVNAFVEMVVVSWNAAIIRVAQVEAATLRSEGRVH